MRNLASQLTVQEPKRITCTKRKKKEMKCRIIPKATCEKYKGCPEVLQCSYPNMQEPIETEIRLIQMINATEFTANMSQN